MRARTLPERTSGDDDRIEVLPDMPRGLLGHARGGSVGKSGSVFEGVPPGELGMLVPSVARRLARRPGTQELRRGGGGSLF